MKSCCLIELWQKIDVFRSGTYSGNPSQLETKQSGMLGSPMSQTSKIEVSSHGFEYGVKHFLSRQEASVVELVTRALEMSPETAQELLELGAIYVDNVRQNINASVPAGKLFRVHTKPRRHPVAIDWLQRIVFESEDFVVLNKPSGVPSHAAVDNRIDNALFQLEKALGIQLMITHRLDTLTEGLLVYGKTQQFVNGFNNLIANRQIRKTYFALVETTTKLPTKLIHYMESSPRTPKKVTDFYQEKSVLCELEIKEQKIHSDFSSIKINLLTGRTHQIRAQTSAVSAPIIGDRMYGACYKVWAPNSIALKACELEFFWANRVQHFHLPEEFANWPL